MVFKTGDRIIFQPRGKGTKRMFGTIIATFKGNIYRVVSGGKMYMLEESLLAKVPTGTKRRKNVK